MKVKKPTAPVEEPAHDYVVEYMFDPATRYHWLQIGASHGRPVDLDQLAALFYRGRTFVAFGPNYKGRFPVGHVLELVEVR